LASGKSSLPPPRISGKHRRHRLNHLGVCLTFCQQAGHNEGGHREAESALASRVPPQNGEIRRVNLDGWDRAQQLV